ncbi:MAG: cytochrome P450 [Sphingobium sp.]
MTSETLLKPSDARPDHVLEELYWDGDVREYARSGPHDDPYLNVAGLFDGPDIIYARGAYRGYPGWLLKRNEHVAQAFMDHEHFSSAFGEVGTMLGVDWRQNPLEIDPPDHRKYRQLLQPIFNPSAINKIEGMVRDVCRELIGRIRDRDGCDFTADFAAYFPSYVFLNLMGMPLDALPQFLAWENAFMRAPDPQDRVTALKSIVGYFEEYTAEKRAAPGEDLVSHIVTSEIDGRRLNHGEVMGMCVVLYLGGLDTVMSSLGWYFNHLAGDPELQQILREDPSRIPAAVDELLRAFGVVALKRVVTRDFEFHGVAMKKGDLVSLATYLASRDPKAFPDPHRIDIDRNARHVTLATGVHNCLGIHLAKREIRIVLEEWLAAFSGIRIAEGQRPHWHSDGVWGIHALPLTWDRR